MWWLKLGDAFEEGRVEWKSWRFSRKSFQNTNEPRYAWWPFVHNHLNQHNSTPRLPDVWYYHCCVQNTREAPDSMWKINIALLYHQQLTLLGIFNLGNSTFEADWQHWILYKIIHFKTRPPRASELEVCGYTNWSSNSGQDTARFDHDCHHEIAFLILRTLAHSESTIRPGRLMIVSCESFDIGRFNSRELGRRSKLLRKSSAIRTSSSSLVAYLMASIFRPCGSWKLWNAASPFSDRGNQVHALLGRPPGMWTFIATCNRNFNVQRSMCRFCCLDVWQYFRDSHLFLNFLHEIQFCCKIQFPHEI